MPETTRQGAFDCTGFKKVALAEDDVACCESYRAPFPEPAEFRTSQRRPRCSPGRDAQGRRGTRGISDRDLMISSLGRLARLELVLARQSPTRPEPSRATNRTDLLSKRDQKTLNGGFIGCSGMSESLATRSRSCAPCGTWPRIKKMASTSSDSGARTLRHVCKCSQSQSQSLSPVLVCPRTLADLRRRSRLLCSGGLVCSGDGQQIILGRV